MNNVASFKTVVVRIPCLDDFNLTRLKIHKKKKSNRCVRRFCLKRWYVKGPALKANYALQCAVSDNTIRYPQAAKALLLKFKMLKI